jgi:hypothetical protein
MRSPAHENGPRRSTAHLAEFIRQQCHVTSTQAHKQCRGVRRQHRIYSGTRTRWEKFGRSLRGAVTSLVGNTWVGASIWDPLGKNIAHAPFDAGAHPMHIALSIGSNQLSKRCSSASASGCNTVGSHQCYRLSLRAPAWRSNARRFEVLHPGDNATLNSNQSRDGTVPAFTRGS